MLRRLLSVCGALAAIVALAPAVVMSWMIGWSLVTKQQPPWLVLAAEPTLDAAAPSDDATLRFDVTIPSDAASSYELGHGVFVARLESQPVVIRIRRARPQALTAAAPPPHAFARQ